MSNPPTASMSSSGPRPANVPGSGGPGSAAAPGSMIGLKSGTKLGKYEIVGRLGLGGMALVYKGYDPLLDRFVAIKQIASHLAADPKFLERFRKEAQILAKLGVDQASVVQIYELIEDSRGLFIVMEYVEGQTLDVLILRHKGPMPIQLALEIIWHLAVGLRAVHERGIIHRDIKPANVMVGVNHRCKITDFGVAARHGGKTSMTLGTTKYMAPELFGGGDVDGRVDVYSLGCIAYEMLCGPEKFGQIFRDVLRDEQAEALRWMKWHTNRELMVPMLHQVNPQVPEVLAKIVAKMMAKDPNQRFASAEHLLEILKRHFTQMGKAQKVQSRKAAGAKASTAAAAAAAAAQRVPEPIPDRPIAQPASRSPEPIAAAPGSPATTKLPKRKMTRRQRITVLCSLIGAMLLGLIVLVTINGIHSSRLNQQALGLFLQAKAVWEKPNFDGEKKRWINENYTAAHQMLLDLHGNQELSGTEWGGKFAKARIDWLNCRLAMQTASNMTRRLWPTTDRPLDVPEGKTYDEALAEHRKNIDDQWKLAKAHFRTIVDEKVIPTAAINSLEKDIRYEEDFLKKIDTAVALMADGFNRLAVQPIADATKVLMEAEAIKKNEDMVDLFAYRNQLEAECKYRLLVKRAKDALANNLEDEAEARLKEAVALRPDDKEVSGLISSISTNRNLNTLREAALAHWNEGRTEEEAQLKPDADVQKAIADMRRLASVDADPRWKSRIFRMDTGILWQKADAAMKAQQYALAEQYFKQIESRSPTDGMKTAISKHRDSIKKLEDLKTTWASARQIVANCETEADVNTAKQIIQKVRQAGGDPDEIAKLEETLRQRRLRNELADANKALAELNYDLAERKFNDARRHTKPGEEATAASIQQKIEEIQVRRQADKMLTEGDKFLREAKYELALREYNRLVAFTKELRDAHKPPSPVQVTGPRGRTTTPPPAQSQTPKVALSVIQEYENKAKDRIREANYQRYIFNARGDIDRGQWRYAEGWLNMALKEKDTKEAGDLLSDVLKRISEEEAGKSGTAG